MGLLETTKEFFKLTYKARFSLYKSRMLFHIYFLMQVPIQKGRFNIHLMDFPFERANKTKNKVDRVHFGNKGDVFTIVNVFNL